LLVFSVLKLELSRHIFSKNTQMSEFRKNPSISSGVVQRERTEKTERTKLVAGSRNSSNAPINGIVIIFPTHIVLCCCLSSRGKPKFPQNRLCYRLSVISCRDTHTHGDILTHSTDCGRVRLVRLYRLLCAFM